MERETQRAKSKRESEGERNRERMIGQLSVQCGASRSLTKEINMQ